MTTYLYVHDADILEYDEKIPDDTTDEFQKRLVEFHSSKEIEDYKKKLREVIIQNVYCDCKLFPTQCERHKMLRELGL